MCLGHTFTHWYPATFYILLPFITLQYGLSVSQAGLLVTIMYVVKAIAGILIGAITDMTNKKNLLMLMSLTLAGLPFLFLGFANAYWMIVILVIIMGIGNEMWHPASFSTLSSLYPKQRGYVFGVHGMSANLGDLLAPLVIGSILAVVSWQEVIHFNIIPAVVVGLVIAFMLRKTNVTSNKGLKKENNEKLTFTEYIAGFKDLIKNRAVLLIALASGTRSMTQLGLMTFLPIFLLLELGYSPFLVGLFITIMQGGGLIAAPLMGKLSDNVGRRKIIFSGTIVTSILIVAVVFIKIDWLLISTLALLGFFLYSLRPVMQAWIMGSTKESMSGTTTSLLFTTQGVLASLIPLIGGIIADTFGIMFTFYFIALIILLGNVVLAFVPKTAAD
ncbi:hypothetical protein LQ50_20185 [Halalkalibacter okhensis]|uniref:Major facilitator superfamily (MFS) profile domain-containing protein n=1 Tax=Halalkalibacter okhensis TaxID=333138 RepID=A0A0B0IG36_9BACI|nr:hypothetical protein LQ50_20185 [Halalkalibacter okhensis]